MEKKVPLRMCVVCKTMQPKKNLIRIVKDNQDNIFVDNSYKSNGRGAYICKSQKCFDNCCKNKVLNKTFKCEINKSILDEIQQNILLVGIEK